MAVRSAADVAKAWKTAEAEIARERKNRERKGETFTGLTKEEFEKKMKRVDSPMIVWQSWSGSAPPGGTISYTVGVQNPDAFGWVWLAVSVSIGNRNAIVSNDEFMTTFDARFPTYAKPATTGFSLAAGATTSQAFTIKIPAGVEKTGYFANACLVQLNWHDVGKYLDRGLCFFDVV
jgi:hypothetical protein